MTRQQLALIAETRAALADGSARERREAAGVRQGEMAATLGVTRQAVSQWESGKRVPGAPHALAYARALSAVRPATPSPPVTDRTSPAIPAEPRAVPA